jgi:hypothetical protein
MFLFQVKSRLNSQGIGKFDESDVNDVLRRDLTAIDALLGDKPYIGGEKPCVVSASNDRVYIR